MAENKYNNQMFDEYIVQGDGSRKQRAENWQIAIGLQDVDRLQNSAYLLDTARQHIEGELDIAAVQQRIEDYYRTAAGWELASQRTDEADIVATRISAVLAEKTFAFIPSSYANLHKRLFGGLDKHAGEYRIINISRREWVLDGESVLYAPYELLRETIEYDFAQEREFSYKGVSAKDSVKHIAKFISGLWQIHPFMEGNTRTIAVFTIMYLRQFGFAVKNEPFRDHFWYFRNAIVRANYNDYQQNIASTTVFLERFFDNLLFDGKNELKNRYCYICWNSEAKIESANDREKAVTSKEKTMSPKVSPKGLLARNKKYWNALEIIRKYLEKKIAKILGVSSKTIARNLTQMRNYVQFVGRGYSGREVITAGNDEKMQKIILQKIDWTQNVHLFVIY